MIEDMKEPLKDYLLSIIDSTEFPKDGFSLDDYDSKDDAFEFGQEIGSGNLAKLLLSKFFKIES